jgi:hypothetical protein
MSEQRSGEPVKERETTKSMKRRGLLGAVGAVLAGIVMRQATEPVEAAYNLQGDTSNTANATTSIGPFTILSNAPVLQVANGFTTGFTATSDAIQAAVIDNNSVGVRGLHYDAGDALYGHSPNGVGVRGHSSGGIAVVGNPGSGIGVYADTVGANKPAIYGIGYASGSVGVHGVINSSPVVNTIAVYGENDSSSSGGFGCYGFSLKGHGLVGATAIAGGGAVVGATNGVVGAYAGIFYGPFIVVGGPKNAAVKMADGTHRLLYCEEASESWFADYGEGQLTNGHAEIPIDAEFALVADLSAYHVFLTAHGDFHVHVSERGPDRFSVRQTTGTGNAGACGTFSWRLVAKRKDIAAPRLAKLSLPPEPQRPNRPTPRVPTMPTAPPALLQGTRTLPTPQSKITTDEERKG